MQKHSVRYLTEGAMIAALYAVLTWLSNLLGLASGVIQLRLAEALAFLPLFCPSALPGLTLGCFLANLLTGGLPLDVLFGTLATAMGAMICRFIATRDRLSPKAKAWLAPLPNIIANTLIIPFVLVWVYRVEEVLPFLFLTVGAGELISSGLIGYLLMAVLVGKFKFLRHRFTKER